MNIGFFEVDEWEVPLIKKHFPHAFISTEKLLPENAREHAHLEVISTFIYSNLNSSLLLQLPKLKCIATRSTGFDHIDISFCEKNEIIVSNVPRYGDRTVAEFTFALLLSLTRRIYESAALTKLGNFDNDGLTGMDLHEKTIGIVGFGKIGQEVAKIAHGFEMKVLVFNRSRDPELEKSLDVTYVQLDDLLKHSDIVTIHLPLVPATKHYINRKNIMYMKKGSYLINTARGGLIETEAIVHALKEGILAGVGLDVLEEEAALSEEAELISSEFRRKVNFETLVMDHVLVHHPRVIVTPHNAFNSREAIHTILTTTLENINSFLKDAPINTISV